MGPKAAILGRKTRKIGTRKFFTRGSFFEKVILHEIEIAFVIFWKRKIILHEIEIAFVIFWKRKIMLRDIETAFVISWKRKIILR